MIGGPSKLQTLLGDLYQFIGGLPNADEAHQVDLLDQIVDMQRKLEGTVTMPLSDIRSIERPNEVEGTIRTIEAKMRAVYIDNPELHLDLCELVRYVRRLESQNEALKADAEERRHDRIEAGEVAERRADRG